ncbi:MAG: hypothetical protein QM820_54555 [Minicystis sp.]
MAAETAAVAVLCSDFARELSGCFAENGDWERTCHVIIETLRSVGHDLWSFDEGPDFQLWCGDWTRPRADGELLLEFRPHNYVQVSWRGRGDVGDVITAEAGAPLER